MKIFLFFSGLALIGAGFAAGKFFGYFQTPGESVVFIVEKGENFSSIAHRLQGQGIVQSERAFRWYANFLAPKSKKLQRGEFALLKNLPVPQVVKILTEGKPIEHKITIPEGYNLFQIGEMLEAKGFHTQREFLKASQSPELIKMIPTVRGARDLPSSIEGYIFPDTYFIQKIHSATEIAEIMLQRFRSVYKELETDFQTSSIAQELGLSPHEVIILASIVEKETGAGHERPLIASVFVNRLRKKMRLQTDPTVIYGVWEKNGRWDGNIRRRDLSELTPYNTYQISGLPKGPIANPGLNAIKSVLAPAESEFLFFVSKNDGTHIFSRDYGSHNRAVKETQLKPGSKEGKSWRDLPSELRAR